MATATFVADAGAQEGPVAVSAAITPATFSSDPRAATQARSAPERFMGSVLFLDQSLTTPTVGLGADYQSSNPTYEWWLAFKPRYRALDTAHGSVSVGLWLNLFVELTDSDTTTRRREPLLGPTYVSASYAHTLRDIRGAKTSLAVGPRFTLPTDKAAWNSGQLLGIGATAELSQTIPLRGAHARALRDGRLAAGAIFNHPVSRSTSPIDGGLGRLRQDLAGRLIVSDQLRGQMNVENSLTLLFSGDVQLLPRLELSASYVLVDSWAYRPPPATVEIASGPAPVGDVPDPTSFRVSTWLTASVGYQVVKELSIAVGYYNLANQIGPDGSRRNPLWSPAARLFVTLVANLDAVYERLYPRSRS